MSAKQCYIKHGLSSLCTFDSCPIVTVHPATFEYCYQLAVQMCTVWLYTGHIAYFDWTADGDKMAGLRVCLCHDQHTNCAR